MINENVTSNKTKYVLVEHELNELSKKNWTNINKMINKRFDKYNILNDTKLFLQEYYKII